MSDHFCYISEVIIFPSCYIRGCKQHWFVSKSKLVSFKTGVGPKRRTLGSADIRGCNQHWFAPKLKLVSFKIGVVPTHRAVGSADAWCAWPLRFDY